MMGSCTDPIGDTLLRRLLLAAPSWDDAGYPGLAELLREAAQELQKCGRENCMGFRVDGAATWVRQERLLELQREVDRQRVELAVCRAAIENAYLIIEDWKPDDDGDNAVRRTALRQLNEAIDKAAPRLLMERPEGQRLYGLNYRDLIAERDRLRAELERNKAAFNEWLAKTKWVQETAEPTELGLHRADVLRRRIDRLRAERDAAVEAEREACATVCESTGDLIGDAYADLIRARGKA